MKSNDLFNMLKTPEYRLNIIKDLIIFFKNTRDFRYNENIKLEDYVTINFYKKSGGWENAFQIKTRYNKITTQLHGSISRNKMYLPTFYFKDEQIKFDAILSKYHREFMLSKILEE